MELKMSDPMEQEHTESGANEIDSSEEGQVMDDEASNAEAAAESDTPDAPQPGVIFEVKFFEKSHFEQLGYRILQAVQKELNNEGDTKKYKVSIVADEDGHCTYLRATEALAEETTESPESPAAQPCELQSPDSPMNPDSPPDYSEDLQNLFMIDAKPATMNVMQVPSYKRAVKEIMDHNTPESKKMKEEDPFKCERTRPNNACFNCGESGHGLRQCPQPRNAARINQAKRAMGSRQSRYHVDVDQRFSHLKPGQTSKKLREALELKEDELPFYFYRMRTLGYPPGWLEDAKVEQSGMYLVGADSKIDAEAREHQGDKYDASKIHDFPGFNCAPDPKFFDDYKYHRVPRLNKRQFKDEFIKSLGLDNIIRGYRRKKMKDPAAANVEERVSSTVEVADMDIEDDSEGSPGKQSTSMEDSGSRETGDLPSAAKDSRSGSQSPSLQDLEEKQRRLMEALLCNTSVEGTSKERDDADEEEGEEGEIDDTEKLEISETIDTMEDEEQNKEGVLEKVDGSDEQTDVRSVEESNARNEDESDESKEGESDRSKEEGKEEIEGESDEQTADKSSAALEADEPMPPSTPKTPVHANKDNGIIKDTHMGTPLLKFSPFDKLPTGENFRCGVSDVINFENLPDSTGKYAQMRGVIKKVRTIITKLNDEADGHD